MDLTGRIPSPERAAAFLDDLNPSKRALLIEELLGSPAYADQLSTFLTNRFRVTRAHDNISTPARDTFYGVDSCKRQIIGYDTKTFAYVIQKNIGEAANPTVTPFGEGTLVSSPNGLYLAL